MADAAPVAAPPGGAGGAQGGGAADPALVARAAALVQALGGADGAAGKDAALEIIALAAGEEDAPKNPSACDALVQAGVVAALFRPAPPDAAAWRLRALAQLTWVCPAARLAVLAADGLKPLLCVVQAAVAVNDATTQTNLASISSRTSLAAAQITRFCLEEAAVRDVFAADANFCATLVALLRDMRLQTATVLALVLSVNRLAKHGYAARTVLLNAGCLPAFTALLLAADGDVCYVVCAALTSLQLRDLHGPQHAAVHGAGVYAAAVPLFAVTGRPGLSGTAQPAAVLLVGNAFTACEPLRPRIRHLLLSQPGALAGVALAVSRARACEKYRSLHLRFLSLLQKEAVLHADAECWLLDAHFAAFAVLELRSLKVAAADMVVQLFVTDWRTADSLHALQYHLPHQALPAAVSLATLAGSDARFRDLLAGGARLELLVTALLEVAEPEYEQAPQGCSRDWQLRVLRTAIKSAADTAGLLAAPPAADEEEAPPAKRQRTGGATFRAEDVNVQRRDSTIFLIQGQPFYAVGYAVESKSSVIADALRNAQTLDPIALPLPRGVAAEEHYATFRAAVEHAYTGGVAGVAAASLLPLWCMGDHLQMDELCAWCIQRIAPCLAADAALLEAAWAAALVRPCDALCDACARAWLRLAAAAEDEAALQLLRRMHAGCAAGAAPAAQLARVLRAALQPPAAAA